MYRYFCFPSVKEQVMKYIDFESHLLRSSVKPNSQVQHNITNILKCDNCEMFVTS